MIGRASVEYVSIGNYTGATKEISAHGNAVYVSILWKLAMTFHMDTCLPVFYLIRCEASVYVTIS